MNEITLHVPLSAINDYKSVAPWSGFSKIISIEGGEDSNPTPEPQPTEKCALPEISWADGTLSFKCSTPHAIFHYSIASSDVQEGVGNSVSLSVTYEISVFATAENYQDSDTSYGFLCWAYQEPKQYEGIDINSTSILQNSSQPIFIQAYNGQLTISGAEIGTDVFAFDLSGRQLIKETIDSTSKTLNTTFQKGDIVLLKIDDRTLKIRIE